jgi:hypothetical protein
MKVIKWAAMAAGALVFVHPDVHAAEYFLNARAARPDLYLYVGAGWLAQDSQDLYRTPFEATLVTPQDYEFAVRGEFVKYSPDGESRSGLGDTTLLVTKNFREFGHRDVDLLSVQLGIVAPKASQDFRSDTDGFVRLRTQCGPTRAKFEGNLIVAAVDNQPGTGQVRTTASAGLRSQYGLFFWGADVIATMQDGVSGRTSADFVVMNRFRNGTAIYASVERRLNDDSDETYLELAFEWRMGL